MSSYHHRDQGESRHYYSAERDGSIYRPRAKLMGVCAGLAHQFGWDVTLVRITALLSLCVFTLPTFLVYVIAGALFY